MKLKMSLLSAAILPALALAAQPALAGDVRQATLAARPAVLADAEAALPTVNAPEGAGTGADPHSHSFFR